MPEARDRERVVVGSGRFEHRAGRAHELVGVELGRAVAPEARLVSLPRRVADFPRALVVELSPGRGTADVEREHPHEAGLYA